jgi:hypothetical protein
VIETPVSIAGARGGQWKPGDPIYWDPEVEKGIFTHSMMKTMRMCPKQFEYKYIQRLKPQILGRPLRFGTWMHELYEAFHKGEDWRAIHEINCKKFAKYFDEEKDMLGNLPRDCMRTMLSYIWHYKDDEWTVHEAEFVLEAELPDGTLYRAKVDLLVENQFGLWIVDHKNHKRLPDLSFRMLDAQSALYVWAALKNKIPVQGHIWNYVRSTPPSEPQMLASGKALSRSKKIVTDYPHLARAIKTYDLDPAAYADKLAHLKSQRYRPGELQTSPFFRRDVLEKSNALLKRVATEGFMTAKRASAYHWDKPHGVERNVGTHCTFMCSYTDLCTTELFGGDTRYLLGHNYKVGDPMDYYQDQNEVPEKGER